MMPGVYEALIYKLLCENILRSFFSIFVLILVILTSYSLDLLSSHKYEPNPKLLVSRIQAGIAYLAASNSQRPA